MEEEIKIPLRGNRMSKQENDTINTITSLIISDNLMSYGERKTLEAFLARLEKEITFSESLNRMLINLQTIDYDNGNKNGLSPNVKVIFDKLAKSYGIDKKENEHIVVTSIGAGRKLTNKELIGFFVSGILMFIIFVLYLVYLYYQSK